MRLKQIQALALDVDGVLTDGGIYLSDSGAAMKRFDMKDGMGVARLRRAGIHVAFISGESGPIPESRAKKLAVEDVYVGIEDKLEALKHFLKKRGVKPRDAAYVGDDVSDLLAMNFAGVAVAPADAHPQVRKAADWVTKAPGGNGAVREIADAILKARAESGR